MDSSYLSPEADSENPLGGDKGSAVCTGDDPPAGAVQWVVVGVPFPNGWALTGECTCLGSDARVGRVWI